jgi:multidrug resistance protein, MATE family
VTCGVLRGLGKFVDATVMAIIAYYVVSLPMEYIIAFKLEYGLVGLWLGQMCGSLFHVLSTQYLISFHYDWNKIAREAKEKHDMEVARLELLNGNTFESTNKGKQGDEI